MPAPIALFAFNRPDHLQQTLAALAANELASESELTIFCDGPRNEKERPLTDSVREVARQASGFASVKIVEREQNYGLANSLIAGISGIFEDNECAIVFEDDILTSKYTLSFLNTCLAKYKEEQTVFNISAWSIPFNRLNAPEGYGYDTYFIPRFNCWGWATWKNRWEKIDWNVSDYDLFSASKELRRAFNIGGQDLSFLLDLQKKGAIDSWAIRMDYARFKHGCVGLNPVKSYTTNIGMGSGTHTKDFTTRFDSDIDLAIAQPHLANHVFVDSIIAKSYLKFYSPPSFAIRVINKISRILLGRNVVNT